eukprot:CAMPEP_0113259464 /NCGR_PEP_ID=MMETSP0008_2-20120614/16366_1 /TAXON_ID=97485 /ORGANISM="Prymnesium parvum" /LENGTH=162 /DNA_ID=CAMNT_0000107985 /DNA_START=137 /DNA_END=625 /DNA_ORIENTATION=+ /assembly_acc=CAM_ASM_000153
MSEFALAAPWPERRKYCADVFEANPSWTKSLMREVRYQRDRHKIDIHAYTGTPFATRGGNVSFLRIDGVVNSGGTLSANSDMTIARVGRPLNATILEAIDGIQYLHEVHADHLALKIDVVGDKYFPPALHACDARPMSPCPATLQVTKVIFSRFVWLTSMRC